MDISPTEVEIFQAIRAFILSIAPAGDAQFDAFIAGNVLTVTEMVGGSGNIAVRDQVLGIGVAPGTRIAGFGTGTGREGTYTLSGPPQTAAAADMTTVMATGVAVVLAQPNRVPVPLHPDYIALTPVLRPRLSTNLEEQADVVFTASIAGTAMVVTAVETGEIIVGARVWSPSAADPTIITADEGGFGGPGAYRVTPRQDVAAERMAAGARQVTEAATMTVQMDIYGPNSGNICQPIAVLLRDSYATEFFAAALPAMSPLFAGDPRQIAFTDGEQQYENRWTMDVTFQVNFSTSTPQQYADQLSVTPVSVEASWPAD